MLALLTYPLALFTAFGMLLPVLIHLWNRRSKKVLVVGSVNPFREGKRKQLKKWYIQDWPLFLLRCALLLSLSIFLSAPKIRQGEKKASSKGWVLLGRGYQKQMSNRQQERVDSLLRIGYELRAFATGFPLIKKQEHDTVGDVVDDFSLIRQLNARLPDDFSVLLFASAKLNRMPSTPPEVTFRLDWQTFEQADADTVSWVQRAWKTNDDNIRALVAFSSPAGTHFKMISVQGDGHQQGLSFQIEDGKAKLKSATQIDWVVIEEKPLEVQLLVEGKSTDQVYLKAFIEAFRDYTSFPIVLRSYQADRPCDLLFDLRITPLHPREYAQAKVIFRYAEGKEEDVVNDKLLYEHLGGNVEWPDLYKIIPSNDRARAVWTDAYKRPVLTLAEKEGHLWYTFYSRFHPQWTGLVWSTALVDYLMPILFSESILSNLTAEKEWRVNDQSAYQGHIKLPVSSAKRNKVASWDTIEAYFLWLALLLFALERIMSYRRRKEVDHGKAGG
ncbi:MAG TPA: BatA domain-containing protein [Pseudosphingobacterium sp.]|nr:BatA domain-containing protein [Pseudosphingobacterium sp.]